MTAPLLEFPFVGDDSSALAERYARMRNETPICPVRLPSGDTAYLVTRHADARVVLSDPRFSADMARPEAARPTRNSERRISNPFADPPDHTRWRRLLTHAFTTRQVARIRLRIRAIADEFVDEMERSPRPVDLMAAFAYPFPIRVLSEVLGIPDIDQWYVKGLVDPMTSATGATAAADEKEAAQAGLFSYVARLIAAKRADLGDDLASALITARDNEDRLDDFELTVSVISLIVAGYENVAKQIGRGMLALLCHPDQLALLREDPDRIPGAVEEMLRYASMEGGFGPRRIALEDVEIDGFTIPRGTSLVVLKQSANRDEAQFENPERFDVGRASAHQHLTFGAGAHYCVGATLARAELQIAFACLLERCPRLRLAVPAEEVPWDVRVFGSGPREFPVVW